MSSAGDASPERQRRSFSPASPPVTGTKDFLKGKQAPQTPPPSVRMSPSWCSTQSLPGLGNGNSNTTSSTSPFESQGHAMARTGSSEGSVRTGQNTPATEIEQSDSEARKDESAQHQQMRRELSGQTEGADADTLKRKHEAERESAPGQNEHVQEAVLGSASPPKKLKTEGNVAGSGSLGSVVGLRGGHTEQTPEGLAGAPSTGDKMDEDTPTLQGQENPISNEDTNTRKRERDETEAESSRSEGAKRRRTDYGPSTTDTTTGGNASQKPVPGAGVLHLLRTQHIPVSNPKPGDNLLEMYSLQDIQQSVARKDPVTGEKINKLRKSYESKVKNLGLEGKPKAKAGKAELEGLVDPAWNNTTEDGGTWWTATHAETMLGSGQEDQLFAKLDSALSFAPGKLPEEEDRQWSRELGLDEPAGGRKGTPLVGPTKTVAGKAMGKTHPGQLGRNSAPASPRSMQRPERQNKKRRYDDSSFTGYNEGFDDDGYSTGGIDDRANSGGKRQKRKDYGVANSPPFTANSPNHMMGVRSS